MENKLLTYARQNMVPYLGHADSYFLGNGIVGGSGSADGNLNFLIGPDYTCPNYLSRETFYITVDGIRCALSFSMHRIRGSGIYCGSCTAGPLHIWLVEYTMEDEDFLCRYLIVQNHGAASCMAVITAEITAFESDCRCGQTVGRPYLQLVKDTSRWCFGNRETRNWADRSAYLFYHIPGEAQTDGIHTAAEILPAECEADTFLMQCTLHVAAGCEAAAGLYHLVAYHDGMEDAAVLQQIEALCRRDPQTDICGSLHQWRIWLEKGSVPGRISDPLLRDVTESLLLCVKMQQNRDGGCIAGIRKYANSYVRDTHGCMRLLNIAGHTEETEKLILNIHGKWERAGFIPNWWSMGSDAFIGHSFCNDASEVTAYYIFMIRDYLRAGGDPAILSRVMPSVKWAAEAQIEELKTHNMAMCFNGDETEQYCCNRDGEEYGGFSGPPIWHDRKYFSFASMTAALTAVEYYAELTNHEAYQAFCCRLRAQIDALFYDEDAGRYHWAAAIGEDGRLNAAPGYLTNYALMPVWIGAKLLQGKERSEALAALQAVHPQTGFLPNCPGIMEGFCGNTLGYALYAMLQLGLPGQEAVKDTILHAGILGQYGTISEFYGPGGTPNGHSFRGFEGGILGEALVKYAYRTETEDASATG